MPKIVSRTVISTSDQQPQEERPPLHTYYCICGEFALISDVQVELLPKRQTDLAAILSCERRVFRLHARDGDPLLLRRGESSYEKQFRKYCTRCNLWLAYQVPVQPDNDQPLPYLYIVDGALIGESSTGNGGSNIDSHAHQATTTTVNAV
ncbi:hypothetical protein SYNPS1DRAFT_18845 [Syncephalis pseudoplumigaleata]|uniref:STEEP1 domain-containing protein n=1 Tax=Syncephalis pseudoplumigaleata TaxID=1712513 RepID=A0A4P9YVM8_9FUNG|nr:hypothetical protein SYNPS1DRAFT_18845 [Syncephalis pseudoplumigaleata]|eukprot:RKP23291.1 hypothetical protein SYNPS1DRAFT_18845 [Syncephalis pseudoplumigaleata]